MQERSKLDDLLLIRFQELDLPFLNYVLSFWPIEKWNEVNSFLFTDYLEFRNPGLQICYPITDFKAGTIKPILANDQTQFALAGHIQEPTAGTPVPPEEIDLVITPLLAFDENGHRLGYGKGCYDRFFATCREDCIRVGLSYFPPVSGFSDTDQFDVPLSYCITPQRVYAF